LNSDLGRNCIGVPLVDAHFIVVSFPAIAAGPEERELQGSTLIAVMATSANSIPIPGDRWVGDQET
jgi:hypothetical protein